MNHSKEMPWAKKKKSFDPMLLIMNLAMAVAAVLCCVIFVRSYLAFSNSEVFIGKVINTRTLATHLQKPRPQVEVSFLRSGQEVRLWIPDGTFSRFNIGDSSEIYCERDLLSPCQSKYELLGFMLLGGLGGGIFAVSAIVLYRLR